MIDMCNVSSECRAEPLSKLILVRLKLNRRIDRNTKVVAQAYDDAYNMAIHLNSVSCFLNDLWPSAHFTQCYAHKWALVGHQAYVTIEEVLMLFFGAVESLTYF